jgi:hypothetical protein
LISSASNFPEPLKILLSCLRDETVRCNLGNGRTAVANVILVRILAQTLTGPEFTYLGVPEWRQQGMIIYLFIYLLLSFILLLLF